MAGFEVQQIPTSVLTPDPDHGLMLLSLILVGLVDVFLDPLIAVWLEGHYDDAHDPASPFTRSWFRPRQTRGPATTTLPDEVKTVSVPATEPPAIMINHLVKNIPAIDVLSIFSSMALVYSIADLSFTVPRGGLFVLLGSNGTGKSTALGVLTGLIRRSGGSVVFSGPTATGKLLEKEEGAEVERSKSPPERSAGNRASEERSLSELTCLQTMQFDLDTWSELQQNSNIFSQDCGLAGELHENAGRSSGGHKRKLQLAIYLVGGSEIVLVDECTSGVDPLSRRSIWRTLRDVKDECTIVFTTHLLDEADLADHITILVAPVKLVAEGSSVALKSRLGKGYTLNVYFERENNWLSSALRFDAKEIIYASRGNRMASAKKEL
ncbi:P-loop containing nucleoside triphosphate hydrolase protein [Gautieria morchelliformis]|nr:P-loop containing nucleoside triphosphate hydrolase protein [Gautieria morchelliformis]